MYIYMGHMRYEETKPYEDWFWQKNRINLVRDRVERIDTDKRRAYLETGDPIPYDVLIIATGSQPNRFGWEGDTLPGIQGLYGLEDLEGSRSAHADDKQGCGCGRRTHRR